MAYLVPLFFHEVSKSNSNIFKQQSLSNTNRESVFGKNVNKIENQTLHSLDHQDSSTYHRSS